MSDAGSCGVVCAWNAGAASLGSVELTPCRRVKCTGVKSGTVGVDETDEKRNVGVGGAPCPARCFFCRALARFNRSSLQHQSLRPAKKDETNAPNLPFKRRAETSDHLCATKDILESSNNLLELDRIHITQHSLTAPSLTNFESRISKARIEQFPVTPRPFTGPICIDYQRSLGLRKR